MKTTTTNAPLAENRGEPDQDLMTSHSYIKVEPPLQPGEPYFVLRGSDLLASYLVEKWAANAEHNGTTPRRVTDARETALKMLSWPNRRYPV